MFQVLLTKYNSTEHSTTQIKPNEAGKKDNHLWVNWHLQNAANKIENTLIQKMAIWLDINLNQVLGLRVMNQNGVRHDIK